MDDRDFHDMSAEEQDREWTREWEKARDAAANGPRVALPEYYFGCLGPCGREIMARRTKVGATAVERYDDDLKKIVKDWRDVTCYLCVDCAAGRKVAAVVVEAAPAKAKKAKRGAADPRQNRLA